MEKFSNSSVEGKPLIDLSASSKESSDSPSDGDVKVQGDTSQSGSDNVEVSVESSQGSAAIVTANIESASPKSEESLGNDDGDKVDKLAKLAQQIDDFDPSPIYNKATIPDIVAKDDNKTVDIVDSLKDSDLVDDLIKESGADLDRTGDVDKDNTGNSMEITPCEVGEIDDVNSDDNHVTNVDSVDNGDDSPQNGEMSASTESEGFQEEKVEEEEALEEKKETMTNKTKSNKESNQKQESVSPTKSSKSKKKEDKSIEHILKALSSLQTTEEKLAALCKKYADLHEEHRIIQSSLKQTQRKLTVTSREKDQLQSEHTKAVMAKSKLESLCRELQKHNQTIRQESLQRAKEEDEKRKEISQKFQTTIGEIQTQMQDNHERNKQLREENFELANKLKKFIEQYEAREKQVEMVIKHRELEQKLADAKLEQASAVLTETKTKNQKEKELLILQTTELIKKVQLKDTELNMYKDRYEEFQSTIKKSEEIYNKFKVEMDKMTKRCKKLEKDGAQWRGKWENANRALLEMAEEKTKYDKERPLLMTKISKLESLCRAMQAERQARKLIDSEKIGVIPELDKMTERLDDLEDTKTSTSDQTTESPPNNPGNNIPDNPGDNVPDSTDDNTSDNVDTNKTEEKDDSDNSCASEQTGITVIEQDDKTEPSDTNDVTANQTDGQKQGGESSPDQSNGSLQAEIQQDKPEVTS
ncbi:hypothetical protein ACF0H5_008270 [Mactra antiquata]